jgi:hypothetical protein
MAKFKPGIPSSFSLDVKPVQDLGDYLDEPGPAPTPPKPSREAPPGPHLERAVTPGPARVAALDLPAALQVAPMTAAPAPRVRTDLVSPAAEEEVRPPAGAARPKAPRREVSMTPDTLRMSDDLLDLLRGGSGQRDTKANELFHALVLLVYEARGELDTHTIPKRGRWGTPTARAYPRELANAFLRAILRKYAGLSDSPTGLRYPVNSAA